MRTRAHANGPRHRCNSFKRTHMNHYVCGVCGGGWWWSVAIKCVHLIPICVAHAPEMTSGISKCIIQMSAHLIRR